MAVVVVVGAGFGDEGKGSITDHLTRKHKAGTVIRFNGGPQAGHNVCLSDGKHHCFSQFGSGTLAGARTHLSRFCLVNPISMVPEGKHLMELGVHDAFQRVTIEEDALIVTPYHVSMNRIRELCRGNSRHGSCGMGIGETVADSVAHPYEAIRARDIVKPQAVISKLYAIRNRLLEEATILTQEHPEALDELSFLKSIVVDRVYDRFEEILDRGVTVVSDDYLPQIMSHEEETFVFEGAQGALLDEEWGFHPHTTRSNCTYENADHLLKGHYSGEVTRIAALRAYHTRHGAGPFPTEIQGGPDDPRNKPTPWQQSFRVGNFDLMLASYARAVLGPIDVVALSHLDQVTYPTSVCVGYDFPNDMPHYVNPYVEGRIPRVRRSYYEEDLASCRQKGVSYRHPLSYAIPVYKDVRRQEHLLFEVSQAMKAPVTILSRGPTAEDKVCLT